MDRVAFLEQRASEVWKLRNIFEPRGSAADAIEKLNAGAVLVQVYSGLIYAGPSLIKDINQTILKEL